MEDDTHVTAAPELPYVALISVPGRAPDPDGDMARDLAALRLTNPSAPLKIKLLGQFQPLKERDSTDYMYRVWPGVSWALEFAEVAGAVQFREDVDAFVREWVRTHGEGGR